MSTGGKTLRSSAASSSRKRGYVPGEPVAARVGGTKRYRTSPFPDIPSDVLDKILGFMLDGYDGGLSVIKLSMVSRAFRRGVNENLAIWYRLYLQWRGPVRDRPTHVRTPRGVVCLRPTVPISVPNFRIKTPPLT